MGGRYAALLSLMLVSTAKSIAYSDRVRTLLTFAAASLSLVAAYGLDEWTSGLTEQARRTFDFGPLVVAEAVARLVWAASLLPALWVLLVLPKPARVARTGLLGVGLIITRLPVVATQIPELPLAARIAIAYADHALFLQTTAVMAALAFCSTLRRTSTHPIQE